MSYSDFEQNLQHNLLHELLRFGKIIFEIVCHIEELYSCIGIAQNEKAISRVSVVWNEPELHQDVFEFDRVIFMRFHCHSKLNFLQQHTKQY